MQSKTDKHFFFEVSLNWLEDQAGMLSATGIPTSMEVATPSAFGGHSNTWSPEHLLIGAVSTCFMTTYLAFANKLGFTISGLECNCIGRVEIVNGKYKFTSIDLYPKIFIETEELREKAAMALEKTHKYCLVVNSLNAQVFYHSQILKAVPQRFIKDQNLEKPL
jgi:peroxiredoxin-like protein